MELTAQRAVMIKSQYAANKVSYLNELQNRKGVPNVIIEFQKEPMFTLGLFMESNEEKAKTLLMKVYSDPQKNLCVEIKTSGEKIQGTTSLNDPAD
jgi:hypothetical protein